MVNSPSKKTDLSFESYFLLAFERLDTFFAASKPSTSCLRLFHGFDDSYPPTLKGLTIDLYFPIILIQTSQQTELSQTVIYYIQKKLPENTPIIYKSRFYENGKFQHKTTVLQGSVASTSFIVRENNIFFSVQLSENLDTGLYLDTALVREWLFNNSAKKKILNLYSYTCSYGIVALLGGAIDVINVDSSRSALQTGKANYEANQMAINPRSFSHLPVNDFLRYARKKKDSFDTIILDPSPPHFSLHTVTEKMAYYLGPIQKCLELLKPMGLLLVSCHSFTDLSPSEFKDTIIKSCPTLTYYQSGSSVEFVGHFSRILK